MITAVNSDNLQHLLPLMREYQTFYQVAGISDEHNQRFFAQFGADSPLGCQFLYYVDNQPVAFATVYFSFSSVIADKVAVMNDLFTLESHRGQGLGKALIEHCHAFALNKGAKRLQWTTALTNHQAQSLYDALPTNKSTWHFYTYNGPA